MSNFCTKVVFNIIIGYPFNYEHIANEATAFDTTVAFPSFNKFSNNFKNPCS